MKDKIAFLFNIVLWQDDPPTYILVYAEDEEEARRIGSKKVYYNSGAEVQPSHLTLCTYGL